jgi:phospholipid/cholesterol/gamma-HCH transport system substrate-binding protein
VNTRNATTVSAAIKLGIFAIVSVLVTGVLAAIMGNIGFGSSREYQAIFSTASTLEKGDDVRIAGVSVGEVAKVEHYQRRMALVTFRVKSDVPMTTATRAEIRFLNLVGDRYLALEEGTSKGAAPLAEDAVIPVSQTLPSLDLTTLFNGFAPLFTALNPDEVNKLSLNLVQVLQGEEGTVQSLLAHTASLTSTLANRDQLIEQVITNLNGTLTTVDQHHQQLDRLIVGLRGWMTSLARDHQAIGSSLANISSLTAVLSDLVTGVRAPLKSDIAKLHRLSKLLNDPENTATILDLLDKLPEAMEDQTRTGTYGSWYNYYLCGAGLHIDLPKEIASLPVFDQIQRQIADLSVHSTAKRCAR